MTSKHGKQMTQLIRSQTQQAQPTTGSRKSQEIHALYKQGLQHLRGQRNMHPEARRVEIAKLYANTKASLKKVKTDQTAADNQTFAKLERSLWGYDLERATAVDRATLDATIRDAQDRATAIKKHDQAAKALHQAEQAGDHILARAIGKRAHDMDWHDVVHDYLDTRPKAAETYNEAGAIWQRHNDTAARMHDGMQYVVHSPEELRGLTEQDITAMTADPGDAAA
ncbi:hypothetical protein [Streptomyces sp. NPDC050564]|uniref:hypothetical protein n=1 Tax=Streptomyces sp. NPDC050564 TaxID=3365631 RepID=UPI0037B38ACF